MAAVTEEQSLYHRKISSSVQVLSEMAQELQDFQVQGELTKILICHAEGRPPWLFL